MLKSAPLSEQDELYQLKHAISNKRTNRFIKWGIYASIAAVGGFFILADEFNQPSRRSTYQQPATRMTPTTPVARTTATKVNSFKEDVPPVGNGKTLTRTQVRYCVFQGERLESMRSLTKTNSQTGHFNQLIDDYNLRCSNFRYRSGVLTSIQSEAASRSSALRADARKIVLSW